jgi:hypothetical protein
LTACAATAATLTGTVLEDATGRPVARARVSLQVRRSAGGDRSPASVLTGSAGEFSFGDRPAGIYFLRAEKKGYAKAYNESFTWTYNTGKTLNGVMKVYFSGYYYGTKASITAMFGNVPLTPPKPGKFYIKKEYKIQGAKSLRIVCRQIKITEKL